MNSSTPLKTMLATLAAAAITATLVSCTGSDRPSASDEAAEPAGAEGYDPTIWPEVKQSLPDFEERIDEVMAKMSVEDKVGQLVMGEIKSLGPEDVAKYRLGGILNGGGSFPYNNINAKAADWLRLSQAFHDASVSHDGDVKIPVLWGSDAVHGHNNLVGATLFPHNIGLGAANNPDLTRHIGRAIAHETAAGGIFLTFAPTVAVPQDDRWGRAYEGYSEDPTRVAELGLATLEGVQGAFDDKGFIKPEHVGATAKHYISDGGTKDGVDRGDTQVTEQQLRDTHGEAYARLIKSNVLVIMASFNSWNGTRLHGHKYLLTDVLKKRMGFDGFVVSDWQAHKDVEGCDDYSCYQSFNAGVDMMMVPEHWEIFYKNTLQHVKEGKISQERLDDAVRRILRVKFILGLFDGATPSTRKSAGDNDAIGMPEHRAIARQAVRESLVLLKNNGNTLPVKAGAKVLVVGAAAKSMSVQSGGWSVNWQGGAENKHFPGATSIYDGIAAAAEAGGGSVEFSKDGSFTTKPDIAIVVYGEKPYAEWHGDVKNLAFDPGDQKRRVGVISALKEQGVPTATVFLSGRPLWMTQEINGSDAFVAAWLPGTEGAGVADVLFCDMKEGSDCDFKGTLSFSWPKGPTDFHQNIGQPDYNPLFAFGYGLSYAKSHDDMEPLPVEEGDLNLSQIGARLFLGEPSIPYWSSLKSPSGVVRFAKPLNATADNVVSTKVFDYKAQEDSQRVAFSGEGKGAWQLIRDDGYTDWSSEPDNAAILMLMQVVEPANDSLMYSLMCGEDCHATADIGDILRNEKGGEWFELAVPLSCIKKGGADLTKITKPVVLHTESKWTISVSTVRLDLPSHDARLLQCP